MNKETSEMLNEYYWQTGKERKFEKKEEKKVEEGAGVVVEQPQVRPKTTAALFSEMKES